MDKIVIVIIGVLVLAVGGYFLFSTNSPRNEVELGSTIELSSKSNDMVGSGKTEDETIRVVMKTNHGDIRIELFAHDAPNTVKNFVELTKIGFYNGTKFHRVIKGFMIQGGDPLTKDDALKTRWGTGGPGYSFDDEIYAGNKNSAGTIAMANAGPNTNGSQFFINVVDNDYLNTKHTVFGKVVAGMDVVREIENVATEDAARPLEAVVIETVTLEE